VHQSPKPLILLCEQFSLAPKAGPLSRYSKRWLIPAKGLVGCPVTRSVAQGEQLLFRSTVATRGERLEIRDDAPDPGDDFLNQKPV
jgi:hypothetical protein